MKMRNGANNAWITLYQLDGEWSTIAFENGSAAAPSIYFKDSGTDTGIYSPGTDQVAISTGGTGRLFIDSSGRLLAGSSTSTGFVPPGESFNTAATVQVSGSSGAGSSSYQATDTNAGDYSLGGSIFLNKRPNNDTGIGSGHTFGSVLFAGWDTAALRVGASIRAASDGQVWASGDCPSRLVFSTTADGASSPTERMRITNGGNILFNATSVIDQGLVLVSYNGGVNQGAIFAESDTTSGNTAIRFKVAGSTVGTITTTSSATAYNTSSDYRLKENVVPLAGAIDRVNDLQVRRFNFIVDPDHTVDGFIAHEAQAVVPECVTGTKDEVDEDGNPKYQGIDQAKLVPLLTAALQEAIAKIETLEARLTAAGIE